MRLVLRKKNINSKATVLLVLLVLTLVVSSYAEIGNNSARANASSGTSIPVADLNSFSQAALGSTVDILEKTVNDSQVKLVLQAIGDKVLPALKPHMAAAPTPITFAGKGTVEDGLFFSPILNRNMPYRIYMPPGYQNSKASYPVLYMLHGLSGSYKEWIDYKLFDTVDALITSGQIKPIIIVLPSGDQEYWVDHADGGPQYGEYVVHDVVGYIDATYRTLPDRQNRAIGGHSMGGQGALQLAFNHPDVFSVVGAHSATLRTKDQAPAYFGDEAFYEAHDPVSLAQSVPAATLSSLKIWLDIGTQDSEWRPRMEQLNQVLTERGIAHTWNEWEGAHAGEYWISHVAQYLQFYAGNLAGK